MFWSDLIVQKMLKPRYYLTNKESVLIINLLARLDSFGANGE
jgi:hypothetical protein